MDRETSLHMLVIAVSLILLGTGTVAYFSDRETITGNTFTESTETPDLELSPCPSQPYLPFNVFNVKPGDSGVADVNLHNAGPVDGWLSMKLVNCINDENDLLEPESEAGDTTLDEGELGSKLYLEIWFDDNNDGEIGPGWPGTPGGEQPITEGYVDALCGIKIPIDGDPTYGIMKSGMTWTIGIKWSVASDVGNTIQSDRLSFDIEFTLSDDP